MSTNKPALELTVWPLKRTLAEVVTALRHAKTYYAKTHPLAKSPLLELRGATLRRVSQDGLARFIEDAFEVKPPNSTVEVKWIAGAILRILADEESWHQLPTLKNGVGSLL